MSIFSVGDEVLLLAPFYHTIKLGNEAYGSFKIVKVNPKNLRVKTASGLIYDAPHGKFIKVKPANKTIDTQVATSMASVGKAALIIGDESISTKNITMSVPAKPTYEVVDFSKFVLGATVRVKTSAEVRKSPKWHALNLAVFFVLKHDYNLVTIVKAGGEDNRFWRVSPDDLVFIDIQAF